MDLYAITVKGWNDELALKEDELDRKTNGEYFLEDGEIVTIAVEDQHVDTLEGIFGKDSYMIDQDDCDWLWIPGSKQSVLNKPYYQP